MSRNEAPTPFLKLYAHKLDAPAMLTEVSEGCEVSIWMAPKRRLY